MHDRTALGPADVTDEQLAGMVAELLGTDPARTSVLSSTAEEVDYELPAITTAGRYWVRGAARTESGERPYEFFVKHVQSWSRSPLFADIPAAFRAEAEAGVPWRTEPLAYRSDLAERLPEGLRMPRALAVRELDAKSYSIWLEAVQARPATWDTERFARAATLMGRLAASPGVAKLRDVGHRDWDLERHYLNGRLRLQVLPALADASVWDHPLVSGAFDDELRERLLRAASRAPAYVAELVAFPTLTSHGDFCPNNLLLPADGDGFVLIDYGFWGPAPLGFDLSQLLVGDVQVGRGSAGDLQEIDDRIVSAYVAGLRAEGCAAAESDVRRAHALQLMIFTGLSSLPLEHLATEPTPALHRIAAERAAIARFSLNLLDRTA